MNAVTERHTAIPHFVLNEIVRPVHTQIVDVFGLLVDPGKENDAGGWVIPVKTQVFGDDRIPAVECRVIRDDLRLGEREKNISDALLSTEKIKKEMESLKSENEILLSKAREERSQMMREAKEMRDKIIGEAKEQARLETNKIIGDAQAVIHQQKMASIIDLKNQVGNLVIEVSEKVLRRELSNKEEQEKYINQLASNIDLI